VPSGRKSALSTICCHVNELKPLHSRIPDSHHLVTQAVTMRGTIGTKVSAGDHLFVASQDERPWLVMSSRAVPIRSRRSEDTPGHRG